MILPDWRGQFLFQSGSSSVTFSLAVSVISKKCYIRFSGVGIHLRSFQCFHSNGWRYHLNSFTFTELKGSTGILTSIIVSPDNNLCRPGNTFFFLSDKEAPQLKSDNM